MLMVREDLAYLETHAGMVINSDDGGYLFWKCIYTQVGMKFIRQMILVDYGLFKIKVEIKRPYCPVCMPAAANNLHKFIKLPQLYPYKRLVSVVKN